MGMSVGKDDDEEGVMSEINTTPLVDVMLVLLIIFLITVPVVSPVKVDLPKQANEIRETKPEDIEVSVDSAGGIFWRGARVTNDKDLLAKMREAAKLKPQPEIHIRGDENGNFESIGKIVGAATQAGILKVGFITEPPLK